MLFWGQKRRGGHTQREEKISNILEEIIEERLEGEFMDERWIFFSFK